MRPANYSHRFTSTPPRPVPTIFDLSIGDLFTWDPTKTSCNHVMIRTLTGYTHVLGEYAGAHNPLPFPASIATPIRRLNIVTFPTLELV